LSPQPSRLLRLLASRPGELITRDEARSHLWRESEHVDFELGLNHCMKRLRAVLRENPRKPRFIETVPRRGYRFVATVERTPPSARSTLAVLPFEDLNHDPQLDYMADGFTEAAITALGELPGVRVLSRQSVLHLRGTAMTLPEIARELNADVVVLGTVFNQGPRIRVNAHLVLTEPERQIWAQAHEAEWGEALILQRWLAQTVAEAVLREMRLTDLNGSA
jgi:TolB-like protein